jgi:hypothetical protein
MTDLINRAEENALAEQDIIKLNNAINGVKEEVLITMQKYGDYSKDVVDIAFKDSSRHVVIIKHTTSNLYNITKIAIEVLSNHSATAVHITFVNGTELFSLANFEAVFEDLKLYGLEYEYEFLNDDEDEEESLEFSFRNIPTDYNLNQILDCLDGKAEVYGVPSNS